MTPAIQTKFIPATIDKPARIKAFNFKGDSILTRGTADTLNQHRKAACEFARHFGLAITHGLHVGGMKGGYVFVIASDEVLAACPKLNEETLNQMRKEGAI